MEVESLIRTFQNLSLEHQQEIYESILDPCAFFLKKFRQSSSQSQMEFRHFLKISPVYHLEIFSSNGLGELSVARDQEKDDDGDGDCQSSPKVSREELDLELDLIQSNIIKYKDEKVARVSPQISPRINHRISAKSKWYGIPKMK